MYSIGDKVVYPMHGAGYIESIESKQIGNSVADYYTVHIINGNIKLCLPVVTKAEIKLRPISSKEEATEVLTEFECCEVDHNLSWNKRYQLNMERLKAGDLKNVGLVVRELMIRDITNGLSTGDRKMLILSRGILITEMALALGMDEAALAERLTQAIHSKITK